MTDRHDRSAGTILRWLRQERGWSLLETVRQLGTIYEHETGKPCPLTISMMGKWERDEHIPSPMYRKLFCLLYQQTASQLGFLAARLPANLSPVERADAHAGSERVSC